MPSSDSTKQATPFPALHTSANRDAEERVSEARKLVDETEAWLADLDALLSEA